MRARTLVLVATVAIAACGPTASAPSTPAPVAAASPAATAGATTAPAVSDGLGERRNEGGGVEVVATWDASEPASLRITLDTHSVDLDKYDLALLARLRIDGGDWTAPSAADVPKGGHHRDGTLTFASVPSRVLASASVIELRITGVVLPERLLRWERAR